MNTDENEAISMNNEGNNYLYLKGVIGKKVGKALYEIDIRNWTDLVQYLTEHTALELSEALRAQGVRVTARTIENKRWKEKAEEMVRQQANTEHLSPQEEAEKPEKAAPNHESQEPVAMFTVSFYLTRGIDGRSVLQTKVYDERNAGEEEVFEGSDTAPWVNWILKRTKLPAGTKPIPTGSEVAAEADAAVVPKPSLSLEEVQIEVLDVDVQNSGVELSSGVPQKRLTAEVRFQLSGAEAETLTAAGVPFQAEVYTIDMESRASALVASGLGQLQPDKFEYSRQQEFPMPEVGRYELYSRLVLLLPSQTMGSYRGPKFKVKP